MHSFAFITGSALTPNSFLLSGATKSRGSLNSIAPNSGLSLTVKELQNQTGLDKPADTQKEANSILATILAQL